MKNIFVLILLLLVGSVYAEKNRYGMGLTADGDGYTINNAENIKKFLPEGVDAFPDDAYQAWAGHVPDYIYNEDYAFCESQTYTFKTYDDYSLSMVVDIPKGGKNTEATYPFIIWVHGGAWSGGGTGAFANQSKYLASRGIAGVRISYSLSGQGGKFDIAMADVKDAFEYVRANAEAWGLDMSRYGFAGGSAGTPLSSLAAFQQHNSDSCKVYIGCNGIYDFDHNRTGSFCNASYHPAYLSNYDDLTEASAIAHISKDANKIPQTILLHGTADNTISYLQSTTFADSINKAGGKAEMVVYDFYVHGFFNKGTSDAFEDVTLRMYDFAYKAFGLEYLSYTTDFEADVLEGDMPLEVSFTSLDTNGVTSWAWDFDNDGNIDSDEENPVFTYTKAGTYTVKLTTSNAAGAFYRTRQDYITVIEPHPPVRFIETFDNASFDRPSAGVTVNGTSGKSYFASKYVSTSDKVTMQSIDGRTMLLRSWSNLQGYVEWELEEGIDSISVEILKGYESNDGTAALRISVGAQSWDMEADLSTVQNFEIKNMGIEGPCTLRLSAIEGKKPVALDNVAWRSYDPQASALNENSAIDIKCFPNPTSSLLNIETAASKSQNLQLYSLKGQALLSQTFLRYITLDLSSMAPGMYLLKVGEDYSSTILVE